MPRGSFDDVAKDFLALVRVGRDRPGPAHLAKLARAFGRLPYENLTKIIRAHEHADPEGRMRMPDIVLGDHLDLGAGGTCFSLTYFFEQVLSYAGYDVHPVFCDRSYGPDTHCALVATLETGRYLVDPGFLLDAPLPIPTEGESVQQTSTSVTRLVRLGRSSQLLLFTERGGVPKLRYRLRDVPVAPPIFRRRWIDSFDWAMMRHMCASRLTEAGQLYLRDGVMRGIRRDGQRQERVRAKLSEVVAGSFGVDPRLVDAARDYISKDAAAFRLKREVNLWTPM